MSQSIAVLAFVISCLLLIQSTQQLTLSETQVLFQIRKQLEYPRQLEAWNDTHLDFCSAPTSPFLMITCEGNSVTELKIVGDKIAKPGKFEGYSVQDHTLSRDFSVDSFITTLTRLTSLRVVILVSLGVWGPLPDKIHRLNSLEVLDLSSNFLYGSIPPKISVMKRLETLTLDGNYFNETVPDWFNLLLNLTVLSLQRNQLNGPLPTSIGKVNALTDLSISGNHISGKIPDLSSLTNLEVLDIRDNELDSEIPDMPKSLVTILLSKNSLSGEIPEEFGELERLQHLDLSFNLLEGTPPVAVFSLPNISYVNLESNMLSGSLPSSITCSSQLGFVDVSTNRLSGDLPSCLSSSLNKRVVKFGGNCLNIDLQYQHDSTYCMQGKSSKIRDIGLMIAVIGGIAVICMLVLLVFVIFCRKNCKRAIGEQRLLPKLLPDNSASGFSSEILASARYISQAAKLGTQVLPTHRVFSLEELKEATRNFERASYVGEGSIGKLYKGRLDNGTFVAIRCLALSKRYSIRNLKLRLDLLSKLRHPNLVCLLGHCVDASLEDSSVNMVFLVYEYVSNGNLRAHLSDYSSQKVLKWSDRLGVLIGIAKAVHFLHTGIIPGFFNNRLRTNNILVDEHCIAKVSDYGLSIISEEIYRHEAKAEGQKTVQRKNSTLETVNLEDDVYSFGLILLEALVGPSISEKGEAFSLNLLDKSFNKLEEQKGIIDPIILSNCSQESLSIVISMTSKCLSQESSARPSIEDVLWNLHYAAQVQATSDGEQRSEIGSLA
ncbi:probable inactive leucine-rich repeat receptor-like protein kinase At3g03770 [Asparagus officinalis]|uniref:probable inactive leucine-rich repeat receptor-like protein kinase At3g03770 n=1 Tax=Asparagus officinalis TaxID=4686 RepID=UPI00098E00E1|nr:probable inactive leucine-rich repeat receptor-like protein kinase At3g03770 [Asparagus officinalis]XP_020251895.1 probable inactive leucine-rich repeat receptor-like protein kinase At3g03770 [Asparagus officinalis]XP_020251896.1 probable inactive leucine-rich repeat receptor-like protein kinase At3g03770 [Asparagus officinalis]